jgi:hypothetical protein
MSPEEPPTGSTTSPTTTISGRLEHEDGLIVNRLAWLMASESFLFTAYADRAERHRNAAAATAHEPDPAGGDRHSALIFVGIVRRRRGRWDGSAACCARGSRTKRAWAPADPRARLVKAGLAAPLLLPGDVRGRLALPAGRRSR